MGQERKRRQRGDGGLFQRGNGLWFASVDLGYIDGKRVRREVSSKTMAGARAKANAVREEVKKRREVLPGHNRRRRHREVARQS